MSVIIPAYNHEKYIEKAMQSVLDQTYQNIELLVLDDGSNDDTYETAIRFRDTHSELSMTVLTKPNEGICRTLNSGLLMVNGDYVCFLASDDYWAADKIEKQVRFMNANPDVGLVFSDAFFVHFGEESKGLWSSYKTGLRELFKDTSARRDLYEDLLVGLFIPALTVLLRKTTLDLVGNFDENLLFEDNDMWLRFSLVSSIGYIDAPLAYYRLHDTNVSNNAVFMIRGYIAILRKHFSIEPLKTRYFAKVVILSKIFNQLLIRRIKKIIIRRFRSQ